MKQVLPKLLSPTLPLAVSFDIFQERRKISPSCKKLWEVNSDSNDVNITPVLLASIIQFSGIQFAIVFVFSVNTILQE